VGKSLSSAVIRLQRKRSPIFSQLEKAQPGLCADFGVERIGIFGSFARGEEKRTSDIDVLVELAPGPGNL